jgi:hypothetical protein
MKFWTACSRVRARHGGHRRRGHLEQDHQQRFERQLERAAGQAEAEVLRGRSGHSGRHAFRIKANKGVNPWDVQASSPGRAINEGDVIMLHVLRARRGAGRGRQQLTARIQLSGAPYTSAMDMTSRSRTEWKSYCAHRVADGTLAEKRATCRSTRDRQAGHRARPGVRVQLRQGLRPRRLKGCDG